MTVSPSPAPTDTITTAIDGVDFGSVGEWVGGLATLAAVVVSIILAWSNSRTARQERELAAQDRQEFRRQQTEEAEQRKRRQAAQVTLVTQPFSDEWGRRLDYQVHNGSDEPIFSVLILEDRDGVDSEGQPTQPRRIVKKWEVIEARGERKCESRSRDFNAKPLPEEQVKPWQRRLFFADGAGQQWARLESGELQELGWPKGESPFDAYV